jgi:flavin reductase (DIM6/NTAB) family NADH-FMN oxidoreductase RutF
MGQLRNTFSAVEQFLGVAKIHSKADLSLPYPQPLVDVHLNGLGAPLDVTHSHLMACGAPFIIGIGMDPGRFKSHAFPRRLLLSFREHAGDRRLLGEISLRFVSSLRVGTRELCLFRTKRSRNLCLSPLQQWVQHIRQTRSRRRNRPKNVDVPITAPESRAMAVFYLCPRPIALVTVETAEARNIFPMNLMGAIGDGYFAFGLNSSRAIAPLVARSRRIVLSSVSPDQSLLISKLGSNHRKPSIEWRDLPFPLIQPQMISAPVPSFALGAIEVEVETMRPLGSHTLFVGRIVAEKCFTDGPQLFHVHGFYGARRQKSESGGSDEPQTQVRQM